MAGTVAVIGVDIGTSSSKGVLVSLDGTQLAAAVREHAVSRPRSGHVEMDATIWSDEATSIVRELLSTTECDIVAVGVSGMGPCVLVTDDTGTPLRPAMLYGVDTRATAQIAQLTTELGGSAAIQARCGSALSTQSVGPKLAWLADEEPDVLGRAARLFGPNSWLAWHLTGAYYLDHHTASQCTPMYDIVQQTWLEPWASQLAGPIALPELRWPGEVVGTVTAAAAERTGLPPGTPVIAGTVDAWSEAVSVGAHGVGDLMLMYGTTMFLINTVAELVTAPALWSTVGAFPGTRNLAAGMATSGAITAWLRDLFGSPSYEHLLALAEKSGPGAGGLLMLPYFAGERTPIADPDARGIIAGLTVTSTPGDLYRAALEATGFGVRHNVETIEAAGGRVDRIVAVGGGAQGGLWTQIVADITGRPQQIPAKTIGASYGAAYLAAAAVTTVDISDWNPIVAAQHPRPENQRRYDERYRLYRELYPSTVDIVHALAAEERP